MLDGLVKLGLGGTPAGLALSAFWRPIRGFVVTPFPAGLKNRVPSV
jgi:hypothetical protein